MKLIFVITLSFLLTFCFMAEKTYSSSDKSGSMYEYNPDYDVPDVCFFPLKGARWNGYWVTNKTWDELDDFQKRKFITEGIGEIERSDDVEVKLEDIDAMLAALDAGIAKASKEKPEVEFPMMKLLRGALQTAGLLEREG